MYKFKSNAKINIFLDIISLLDNGYHNIRSVFCEISFFDDIKYKNNKISKLRYFTQDKNILPENNLVVKAGKLFNNNLKNTISGLDFFLKKNIPLGSGLGGGSSNAAAVIKILNEYYNLKLSSEKLKDLSKKIGADVPFFIDGGIQKVEGFGEKTNKIIESPLNLNIILVFPEINISTVTAYKLIDKKGLNKETTVNKKKYIKLLNAIKDNNYQEVINNIYNKFEEVIFPEYPKLKKIYNEILDTKADKVFMSGSGSTLVGIYPTVKIMKKGIRSLKKIGYRVKQVKIIK